LGETLIKIKPKNEIGAKNSKNLRISWFDIAQTPRKDYKLVTGIGA